MQAFRNSAKPLIFIVAVSFFAWLVLDLSGLTGGTGFLTATSVGKINGRSVDARTYSEAVSQLTSQRQQQSTAPLGIAETAQIRDQVWEQFIRDQLLAEEYDKWGVTVSPDEVAEAIRAFPPQELTQVASFQTDGQFDLTKYQNWLRSAEGQATVPYLEAEYRSQILQSKLARHLAAPVFVSDAELWAQWKDRNEQVRVGMAVVPSSAITEATISVTPTEIQEYYNAHRSELEREATAFLSYVRLDRQPNASDSAAALQRVSDLKSEIEGGAPFAEVARRESADTVSGAAGGDLGEWTRGRMTPAFDSAAFAMPLNRLSDPVRTPFGYHLLEITSRRADTVAGRHILVPIEVTGAHRDELDARADSLESLAADRLDPAALDTAARALGLAIQRDPPVTPDNRGGTQPDAAVWAFQAEAGEHSPVVETPEAYFVFRLDSLWEAGVPSLEAARAEIHAILLEQKRRAEARRLAELVLTNAGNGSLAAAAATLGVEHQEMGPFSRITSPPIGNEAVGAAFGLDVGARSRPIESPSGYVILEILEKVPADSAQFAEQLPQLREQALVNQRTLFFRQYFLALRDRARIVDNRARIYQTEAQAAAAAAGQQAVLP